MRRAVGRGAALAALAVAWRFGTLTHALGGSECVVDARGAVAARRLDLGARAWLEAAPPRPYTVLRCGLGPRGPSAVAWERHRARLAAGAAALHGGAAPDEAALVAAVVGAARPLYAEDRAAAAAVCVAVARDGSVAALAAPAAPARAAAKRAKIDATGARRPRPTVKDSAWCAARRPAEAAAPGFDEVLLADGDALLEGLTSNLLVLDAAGATLRTAPAALVLPGVGRELAMAAAAGAGVGVVEEAPALGDLAASAGAFLANANGFARLREVVGKEGETVHAAADGGAAVAAVLDAAVALAASPAWRTEWDWD